MPPRTRAAAKRGAEAASTAVFDTVELLENILLNLPMKDLLLDARVCRKWKEVINGSISLQRALFMKAEPVDVVFRFRPPSHFNKIPEDDDTRWFCHQKNGIDFIAARINPLFAADDSQVDEEFGGLFERIDEGHIEFVDIKPLQSFEDFNASWRRMFLTQPPVHGQLPKRTTRGEGHATLQNCWLI